MHPTCVACCNSAQATAYMRARNNIIRNESIYAYARAQRRIIRDGDYCPYDNFRGEE